MKLEEGERYVLEYYPKGYTQGEWKRNGLTKIEEFIIRDGRIEPWTGSYRIWSTGTISKDDVVRIIKT